MYINLLKFNKKLKVLSKLIDNMRIHSKISYHNIGGSNSHKILLKCKWGRLIAIEEAFRLAFERFLMTLIS